ncbi:hypothetical protein INT45_008282 [Circinella minor]|uniref:C2H2-type domain-containing protein n=1 Tax=Circinella minor TaxID=1195481 RepID=A0A8H7S5T1_9FUNG|nr:hypothetical protein INT45_008282 [Circinella minor]
MPILLHHNHPDIFSSSSEIANKFQLEQYYNMDLINHNMNLLTDVSVEASTNRRGTTSMTTTGLSTEDGNSNGSFYTNSNNNNKAGTFSSINLLNNTQATISTTTANAEGCISSCSSKYPDDFLTYQAFNKPTKSDALETIKRIQRSSPQTMKNSLSTSSQGYNDINQFHYETNDHGISLQQQQEEYSVKPIFNTSCSPIPINRQEAQYNNMNNQQQELSFLSMLLDYNLNQTPCSSSTLSYSVSSLIMDDCDMLNFDQQIEMSTSTTKTTTAMISPALVKDSTNGFEDSPIILNFQKTATSGTSNNNSNINDTTIPQSSSSYINMLHRNNNSFSSFGSSSSLMLDTPPTHDTLPNYSVIPHEDRSLSLPNELDMITTTTLKEKEKPNYYNQPMIPLSSCYSSTSTTNTSLNFHVQSNNNISLSQYTNNKPIRIAPYSPSLSKRNRNQSNQHFIKHQQQMTESDTTTTTTTTKKTAKKKRKYSESDPCGNCGKKFTREIDRKRHENTVHTRQKKYKCRECGRSFSRHDSLLRHERKEKDCRPC